MNTVIQVSDNGYNDFTVDVLEDGECSADSHYEGKDAKAKAERRAEVLAKMLGCDWESNY